MGRTLRTAAVVATLVLPGLAATACGADTAVTTAQSAAPSAAPATTVHDMAAMQTGDTMPATRVAVETGLGDCAQRMPGELLTAAEAVVRFDPQMVCLGYVTVNPGTLVTWRNGDAAEHTVTILDDEGTELNRFTVAGGAFRTTPAAGAGIYRFKVSAIESFVGTIEVQA